MTKKLSKKHAQNVVVKQSNYAHIAPGTMGVAIWNRKLKRFEVTIQNCPHPMGSQPYYNGEKKSTEATYAFREEELMFDFPAYEPGKVNRP